MKYHVKAFMDSLYDQGDDIFEKILESIPNKHDDDVFEFDITIDNVKEITEEVGVDEEGFRAFQEVEIKDIEAKGEQNE